MDILWYSLKVAVVGMLVVFVGLIILIGCIRALKALGGEKQASPPEQGGPRPPVRTAQETVPPVQQPAPEKVLPVREYVPGPALTRKDDAFYAVISGAIAETLAAEGINPDGGFEITSITTVNDPAAPKLTVKDSTLYAVISAAISEVLSAEGVNPEGGFTIQSVKAL